jgi:hypothetical protein
VGDPLEGNTPVKILLAPPGVPFLG